MKRIISLKIAAITLLLFSICFAAATSEPNENSPASESVISVKPKQRADTVTMADFYLRDGNVVSGRLLSDDKNQVVIEQTSNSTLITKSYTKKEIDTRTLATRIVPESRYYAQLAEYFKARTWDFTDDPDDFIQAIRCYEKAKQSLGQSGAELDKLAEIDKAIQKIKTDREVWTSQVESRAKLKTLEYDAEAESRLKNLEKQVFESNIKLNESIKYLDKTAADIKGDYQQLQNTVAEMNKDLAEQIRTLEEQIQDIQEDIKDIQLHCCPRPRPIPPRSDTNNIRQ
jgi:chromosome segregation ATPase